MRVALLFLGLVIFALAATPEVREKKSSSGRRKSKSGVDKMLSDFTRLTGIDAVFAGLRRYFNGKRSVDFRIFGRKFHIRFPKFPANSREFGRSWETFQANAFTRTVIAVFINIVFLFSLYTFLFIRNVYLACKYRKLTAAANDDKPLIYHVPNLETMTKDGNVKSNKDAKNIAQRFGFHSSNTPQKTKAKKFGRKLTNQDDDQEEIPRLVGDSSFDDWTFTVGHPTDSAHLPERLDHEESGPSMKTALELTSGGQNDERHAKENKDSTMPTSHKSVGDSKTWLYSEENALSLGSALGLTSGEHVESGDPQTEESRDLKESASEVQQTTAGSDIRANTDDQSVGQKPLHGATEKSGEESTKHGKHFTK